MTIGEILSVKKVIQNVFPENRDLEEVSLKSKYTFFKHLDDPSTHEDTNDYVFIKIKKIKDSVSVK